MSHRSQSVGRRHIPQLPVSVPLIDQAAQFEDREFPGTAQNRSWVPGSVLDLTLETRGGPLALTGQVAWAEPSGPQVAHGIAFHEAQGDAFARDFV